jgi:hypothetical protein
VRVTVVIPDYDHPDRPEQEYLQIDLEAGNASLSEYDRIRADLRWPKAVDGPSFWLTWVAWHVLSSEGAIPKTVKFDQFRKDALEVRDTDKDENADVDPTSPTSEPTS